ncbi:uncharacterized protein SAPINGB_P003379 [Magnusiomyces paraingens]|uniref:SART-1 protein n=1 Tax=Magnusiomyces paraingens TaxID=2606893 RepID=A0A5E8BQ32_9ASCO|nr:uncharacterized protein SAPINGB_P003379 [Saprochaete ingens]VVT53051.1 unnamed protein product [Saprochaete ingens]
MTKDDNVSEISIEETNKLRVKLGLRPIPLPDSSKNDPSKSKKEVALPEVEKKGKVDIGDSKGISLEETNKLRISLGLKPIVKTEESNTDVNSTSSLDQDSQARKNWIDMQEKENAKKRNLALQERIQKQKEKALLRKSTSTLALGGGEDEEISTLDWLKKLRQSQKAKTSGGLMVSNPPKKTNSTIEGLYTSKDLSGVKVAHDIGEVLKEGESVILTLKDRSVLDEEEEGDVLESTDIVEKENLKEKLEAKKGIKRLQYDDYDDEDNSGILSKYDDVINNRKSKGFTLDNSSIAISSTNHSKKKTAKTHQEQQTKKVADLDEFEFSDIINTTITQSSDYQAPISGGKAPKIKKKKKSLKKSNKTSDYASSAGRKRQREDDYQEIDQGEDDEELQNLLASSRRKIQHTSKVKRIETPQEIAEKLREEQEEINAAGSTNLRDSGMVINQTTDFLAVLRKASEEPETEKSKENIIRDETKSISFSLSTSEESRTEKKDDNPNEAKRSEEEASQAPFALAPNEPTLSGGMADALKLLRSRGVIKEKTKEQLEEERIKREQRDWNKRMKLARIERDIEIAHRREKDRATGKFDKLTQKDRETLAQRENMERDKEDAQIAQKRFENYKPKINLEYRDETGRLLSQKEAYKHLSHQFHGKGPGKGKIEKQIKRQSEEKKKMSESIFTNEEDQRAGPIAGVRLQ